MCQIPGPACPGERGLRAYSGGKEMFPLSKIFDFVETLKKKKKSVIMQEENLNVYFLCFAASVHQRVFLLYSQETAGSRKNSRVVE